MKVVEIGKDGYTIDDILVHDAHCEDNTLQTKLALMGNGDGFPVALGVIRDVDAPTYDGMGNDVERIIVCHKRSNVQACHILDGVLFRNPFRKRRIPPHLVTQLLDTAKKGRMRTSESLTARFAASIQYGTICQNDTNREKHLVRIGMSATIHPRGIVAHDAAHHGTLDGSRRAIS